MKSDKRGDGARKEQLLKEIGEELRDFGIRRLITVRNFIRYLKAQDKLRNGGNTNGERNIRTPYQGGND